MKRDQPTSITNHPTAEAQLASFIAKYPPTIAALGAEVRLRFRRRHPTAIELVYDNYDALVLALSPTERPSDAIFSIVFHPLEIQVCFLQVKKGFYDPEHRLQGRGRIAKHLTLTDAAPLDEPAVDALMRQAIRRAKVPFATDGLPRLIIRYVAALQRPRRPYQ